MYPRIHSQRHLFLFELGPFQGFVQERLHLAFEGSLAEGVDRLLGDRLPEDDVREEVTEADGCGRQRVQDYLGLSGGLPQTDHGARTRLDIDEVFPFQLKTRLDREREGNYPVAEVAEQFLVDGVAAEAVGPNGGLDLEGAVLQGNDGDARRTRAYVEHHDIPLGIRENKRNLLTDASLPVAS